VPAAAPRPAPAKTAPPSKPAQAAPASRPASAAAPGPSSAAAPAASFKDALLAEIRKSKAPFYNMVVAQAQRIEVTDDRVAFTFSPTQRFLLDQVEQNRSWLETVAQQLAGRKVVVTAVQLEAPGARTAGAADTAADKKAALRQKALSDAGVQALLEVFPAEIRDVEEM